MLSNSRRAFAAGGGKPRHLRPMRRRGRWLVSAVVDESLRREILALWALSAVRASSSTGRRSNCAQLAPEMEMMALLMTPRRS